MQAHGAGEPADLKHGDVVLFGSDSQVRVSVTPSSDESTTVEQHLRLECEMLMQRVRVRPCTAYAGSLLSRGKWSLRMQCMTTKLLCSSTTKALHRLQCLQDHLLAIASVQSHKG